MFKPNHEFTDIQGSIYIPEGLVDPREVKNWPLVMDNPRLLNLIESAIDAGAVLNRAFHNGVESSLHNDSSDHTYYDGEVEHWFKTAIKEFDPNCRFLGEEFGGTLDKIENESGLYLVDPIDGTTNFSRGIPIVNFTACYTEFTPSGMNVAKIGIVYDFIHNEMYYAVEGEGAYLNGQKLERTTQREIEKSLVSFSPLRALNRGHDDEEDAKGVQIVREVMKEYTDRYGRFSREIQSGGLELAYLAAGKLDAVMTSWTSPYDLSAGVLIARESGCICTDLYGTTWIPSYKGVLCATENVHKALRSLVDEQIENLI